LSINIHIASKVQIETVPGICYISHPENMKNMKFKGEEKITHFHSLRAFISPHTMSMEPAEEE
jgi:hypothetical protein